MHERTLPQYKASLGLYLAVEGSQHPLNRKRPERRAAISRHTEALASKTGKATRSIQNARADHSGVLFFKLGHRPIQFRTPSKERGFSSDFALRIEPTCG
jgi:hypothetical protein